MVYYGVLTDSIETPKTNEELINSIIKKAASIVEEYGVPYVMKNNSDHYFDKENNEIIKLSLDPIINRNAEKVYNPHWKEYVVYNYTKNSFSLLLNDEKGGYTTIGLGQASNQKLKQLDNGLCDCKECAMYDKKLLADISEKLPKGAFFVKKDKKDSFYYVSGTPYLCGIKKVKIPCKQVELDRYNWKPSKIYSYMWKHDFDCDDIKDIKVLSKTKLLDFIFDSVKGSNLDEKSYRDEINRISGLVEEYKQANEKLAEMLKAETNKKQSLQIQLKIAENEENIELGNDTIKHYKKDISGLGAKIEKRKKEIEDEFDKLKFEENGCK